MTHAQITQEIAKYRSLDLHRKVGTNNGFFEIYFMELPRHSSRIDAFNYVNDLHFQLFGEVRYASYNSFYNSLNRCKKRI